MFSSISFIFMILIFDSNNKKQSELILFYSRHRNTFEEIKFAFKLNNHIDKLVLTKKAHQLDKIYGYETFINTDIAIENICNRYSLIIICESILIGRPFFEKLLKNNCNTKIALQIVDRVDRWVDEKDKSDYLKLIQNLTSNKNVYWIPNNPYEIIYLNNLGIYPKLNRLFLIKPYGVKEKEEDEKAIGYYSNKSIIYLHQYMYEITALIKNNKNINNNYKIFEHGTYGGPRFLRKQKIFIYFPYQSSTMKVFDNAANGVLTAVPTPEFFHQLALKYLSDFYLMPELLNFIQANPKNWTEYFDIYNKKYIHMYVTFNNWTQFENIVNNEITIEMKNNYLKIINETMEKHKLEVDLGWKYFFNQFYETK